MAASTAKEMAQSSCAAGYIIRIGRAPTDLPFRWHVTVDDRKRAALSLVAVLRQVREALDPGYATLRPRIAPVPLVAAGPMT